MINISAVQSLSSKSKKRAQTRLNLAFVGVTFCLLGLAAPSFSQTTPSKEDWDRYYASVGDAAIIEASEIHPINPLLFTATAGGVKGEPRVTVVSWTPRDVYKLGDKATKYEHWVVQLSEMKFRLRTIAPNMRGKSISLRIAQLLGLPPDESSKADKPKQQFVTLSVPESAMRDGYIFRPTADPSTSSHSLALSQQVISDFPRAGGSSLYPLDYTRWLAGNLLSFPASVSGDHVRWFATTLMNSYTEKDSHFAGYPWTRLGYTYDWAVKETRRTRLEEDALEYGLSEYVIRAGTAVEVLKIQSTEGFFNEAIKP